MKLPQRIILIYLLQPLLKFNFHPIILKQL